MDYNNHRVLRASYFTNYSNKVIKFLVSKWFFLQTISRPKQMCAEDNYLGIF